MRASGREGLWIAGVAASFNRKESSATLATHRFEVRFENLIPTTPPLGKLLPCHYVMMDCHWF